MILKNHIHQNLEPDDLCMSCSMENTNTSNSMGCKLDNFNSPLQDGMHSKCKGLPSILLAILAHTYGFLLESSPQVATTILHAKERDFHNRNEITIDLS